jgi:hypothetical protein
VIEIGFIVLSKLSVSSDRNVRANRTNNVTLCSMAAAYVAITNWSGTLPNSTSGISPSQLRDACSRQRLGRQAQQSYCAFTSLSIRKHQRSAMSFGNLTTQWQTDS